MHLGDNGSLLTSLSRQVDPALVLIVDDTASTRELLSSVLTRDGYRVESAVDGSGVAQIVRDLCPDLILMDVRMPKVDGFEACASLKSQSDTRLTPVVLITGLDDSRSRVRGIEAGADDFLTKPFNLVELRARVRSLVRIKKYTDDLDSAEATVISLALTIEARDPFTNGHCQRLATCAERLGGAIGLSSEEMTALTRGAFLHDIGKVGIADAILLKPGPLPRMSIARCNGTPSLVIGFVRSCAPYAPCARSSGIITNDWMAAAIRTGCEVTPSRCWPRSRASSMSSTR